MRDFASGEDIDGFRGDPIWCPKHELVIGRW